ncbi:MAG: thioredoxin domain-containing protein [Micropepsaceae bacterium]
MDNRYLVAGGVGAAVVAVVAAAFFFLMPKEATIASGGDAAAEQALAIKPSDIGLGDPNAPIKMIEYASAGCGHCAAFAIETLPKIKADWIDKGQVYYVLRDYPLDTVAYGASAIARCLPREGFYPFMDVLFHSQADWHKEQGAIDALATLARRAGLSRAQVESCLKDEKIVAQIRESREEAVNVLAVNSTPTMFVNGEKVTGAAAYADFEAKFKAALEKKPN